MALFKLRDTHTGIVNLAPDGEPNREVRVDPKVTYNTDDPQDAELVNARPGLFREVVTEAPKRSTRRKKDDDEE